MQYTVHCCNNTVSVGHLVDWGLILFLRRPANETRHAFVASLSLAGYKPRISPEIPKSWVMFYRRQCNDVFNGQQRKLSWYSSIPERFKLTWQCRYTQHVGENIKITSVLYYILSLVDQFLRVCWVLFWNKNRWFKITPVVVLRTIGELILMPW